MARDALDVPPIRFADSGGARIAYQRWGDGDVHLVAIPPMAQNIEMAWEWPDIRVMLERFGSFATYTHFDKRGTGSSDRHSQVPGLDERVQDLLAVMDHAGIERAHLLGLSEGGPMTILAADSYPDRVLSLILYGTAPSLIPAHFDVERIAAGRQGRQRLIDTWGTPESVMVDVFAPSLADNDEFRRWHQVYERRSSSPQSLRELFDLYEVDVVSEILPRLQVPTLVLHRTGDPAVPLEVARNLAAAIPGARLIEHDGTDHFQFAGDIDGWMTDVERWVTGTVVDRPPAPSPGRPQIVTLGRFAVEVDGVEVPTSAWGSRLARQLCKRLVVARGWPVTREELVEQLWPGEDDLRRLSARLSVHLSGVRRILGAAVLADRATVRLDLEAVDLDLERFHRADDDEAIVAAYGGELLPEERYEDWSGPARDEARARFGASAHRLATGALAVGRHGTAIDLARRLVASDRYDEAAHRLLVVGHLGAGQVGEARRAHRNGAEAMSELDVELAPFEEMVAGTEQ
mgnify:CR=1 FL=1